MSQEEETTNKRRFGKYNDALLGVLGILLVFGGFVMAVDGTGIVDYYALWSGNETIGVGLLTQNVSGLFFNDEQVCTVENNFCGCATFQHEIYLDGVAGEFEVINLTNIGGNELYEIDLSC
jgi:hypothetical protein